MSRSSLNVLGCYILWGLLPVFWKLLADVSSVYVLAQRIVFSFLFCLAAVLVKKHGGELKRIVRDRAQCRRFILCGLLISSNWGVYIYAVATNRILESSLAYYINPLCSVLIGSIYFREKLGALQWLSAALALIGVSYSVINYGSVPYIAIVIAVTFAVYSAIKKNVSADSETSMCIETAAVLPIAIAFIIYAQLSGYTTFSSLTTAQMLLLAATGPVTSIPLMLFAKGIKNTSIVTSGILMYVNPTLQLLVGVFIYNEAFTKTSAVTFAFTWAAVALFVYDSLRQHKKGLQT